jgi:CDP-6-deoxy-D-xylo-4-hexulose-3-dehydrase
VIRHLDQRKIATRLLFGGNLVHQPYMIGQNYRVSGALTASDTVMTSTFWLGVYPGLTPDHIDYMADQIDQFCKSAVM